MLRFSAIGARLSSSHGPKCSTTAIRLVSNSTCYRIPRKDTQDRESMDTAPTEYSKSGTDTTSAKQEKAAFDPTVTSPEKEKEIAGRGNEGNPLNVSPANRSVSESPSSREKPAQGKETGEGECKLK
ncbi:hypothetical protein BGHDH14_bgh03666 [Blumeria hordei DH14]|uniref:Uncharacterized protein n=1 Tax=Blumeria graminis f. sp. hordei (strain DH14) TaxID=546991 RepID=N1J8X4_BLUG1|nr:hypothetical protein BGHDH14_bgh03666 [Blumeria hordei DH14]